MENRAQFEIMENRAQFGLHGAMMGIVSGDSEGPSDDENIFDTTNTPGDILILVDYFVQDFKRRHGKDMSSNGRSMRRLRTACERAKCTLSSSTQAYIQIDSLFDGVDFNTSITRARFEGIVSCNDSMSHGEIDPNEGEIEPNEGDEFLYDEKLDEEDENYVYMNLRGGKHDQNQQKQSAEGDGTTNPETMKKPRNSDAILSCPCCFRILSLDTQRHYKYNNQFRAMFVMGISVDWQHRLKYDGKAQGLVQWHPQPNDPAATQIVAPDHQPNNSSSEDPIYYAVSCANCQTMVAALDLEDETYHFYDCLVSS